jgi:hypothetical protein
MPLGLWTSEGLNPLRVLALKAVPDPERSPHDHMAAHRAKTALAAAITSPFSPAFLFFHLIVSTN